MKLSNQQRVVVKYDGEQYFEAFVVGTATTELPIIGRMVIIKPYSTVRFGLPKDIQEYPFDCMVVPETSLKAR